MNKQFLLGDPKIDRQHAHLFALIDKLVASEHSSSPDESANFILGQLGEHLFQHFQSEELLMKNLQLTAPLFGRHVEAHMAILEELAHIHWVATMGHAKPLAEVIDFVKTSIEQHLIEFDLALKPYIARAAIRCSRECIALQR